MLDFIYTVFIAPLEYWMKIVLVWGHGVCEGNWGWAIVFMSLVVNTVILPIYMKAESWQEEEQKIRLGFEAKEAMIKRAFKGQERFAMISTMRRQAGYTAFLSMRSSVGFFLQIPFFFAAYHFLSHFEPLLGVSFLGLADLGRPDEAIRIGSFAINVMPILMTVINVGSALIYTKNLARRDKIQLYAMAALFLVLLYDAASGLVLYWTCNNIYSLLKNIVYDVAHRVHLGELLSKSVRWIRGKTEQRFTQRKYSFLFWSFFGLWSVASILAILSSNQIDLGDALRYHASHTSDWLYLFAMVSLAVGVLSHRCWRTRPVLALLILFCVFYLGKVLIGYEFLGFNRHAYSLQAGFISLILGLVLFRDGYVCKNLSKSASLFSLYFPASIWFGTLLVVYLPLQAFSSAPEAFSSPDIVIAHLLLLAGMFGVAVWLIWHIAYLWNLENFVSFLVGLLGLLFTCYAFLPMDVGTIDAFQISNPAPLYSAKNVLIDLLVGVAVLGVCFWILRKGLVEQLAKILGILSCVALLLSVSALWQGREAWRANEETFAEISPKLPEWTERFFGFSRNHTNTVIVMFDAFSGDHMRQILDEAPEVTSKLTGFTWYSDAMASGNSTMTSMATILAGESVSVGEINRVATGAAIPERVNAAYVETIMQQDAKTDISLSERNWLIPPKLKRLLEEKGWKGKEPLVMRYMGEAFLKRWCAESGEKLESANSDNFLLAVSIFRVAPWTLKNAIYKDGGWLNFLLSSGDSQRTSVRRSLRDWSVLSLLPSISNAEATGPTLKFFDSELTHVPNMMELGKCRVVPKSKNTVRANGVREAHLATEICSLKAVGAWFDWMKKNNVYENTNIVLVSDHGGWDSERIIKLGLDVGIPDSLFLFKPAGKKDGKLREDRSPVQISNIGEWLRGGQIDRPKVERFLFTAKPIGTQYKILNAWKNRGRIDNPSSWQEVPIEK